MTTPSRTGIGYVLRRFPKISETFVLNEILALEARGERITIFSLGTSRDSRFHADLGRLQASVCYVPGLEGWRTLLRYGLRALRAHPRGWLRALARALGSGRPRLLWRLLQGGYVAERCRRLGLRQLHAHFATDATEAASLISAMTGLPFSFTAHAVDIYKEDVNARQLARHMAEARFVVAVSECSRAHLETVASRYAPVAPRIVRIHNGIDLERFQPRTPPPPEPFTVLAVARLVEKKGLDTLIEACALLRERGQELRCWIVGKGQQRRALQALIARRGVARQVRLLGAQSQEAVRARYAQAHLFVLPCRVGDDGNRDGLPVSIVEALACGLPVLSTAVTGIPEVVRDGVNGRLLPERDPRALADAIEALAKDRERLARLAAHARGSVEPTFDLGSTAATLQRQLREVAP